MSRNAPLGEAPQLGPLPGGGQASQQLLQVPGVPSLSVHFIALLLILQLVALVVGFVRQQVTKPGFPHVEWAAHFLTAPLHVVGKKLGSVLARLERVFATPAAHLTYCPWFTVGGLLWSHVQSVATCCRAANVLDPPGSSAAQFAKATGTLASSSHAPRAVTAKYLIPDLLSAVRAFMLTGPSGRQGRKRGSRGPRRIRCCMGADAPGGRRRATPCVLVSLISRMSISLPALITPVAAPESTAL